ncbi:uncharacterized protein LOC118428295 [Branchiostoma floridae]|uniref:Uncharacterized protein LOC118428295 n=2 Tax=Branchiostoma floridae TaxID=7739 RepID=A0A9J7M3R9_BRAFL|nr:uncharacterized protein LOC118428295 [Branchiostoma floridae]
MAVWLCILLTALLPSLEAAIIERALASDSQDIPFWNKSLLCNYHDCFSKLKTWPEVPYYLIKDGQFRVDWSTKYIRISLIYNKNAFVKVFKKNRQAVENHALELVSMLDKAYRTINFRVLLSDVEILEDLWPGETENPHLYNYLKPKVRQYIWNKLQSSAKKFDTAAFITGPPYYQGSRAIGHAMGDLCEMFNVNDYPHMIIGYNKLLSGRPADLLGIMTHEMGHQFHMGHPSDPLEGGEDPCPTMKLFGSSCTMKSNGYPKSFGYDFFHKIRTRDLTCLDRKPAQSDVFKCGNGILDNGEECDCGSSQTCLLHNPCCDGQICKLKRGAQCADGQKCCSNCKMNMESCPVDVSSSAKRSRLWVPFEYSSTYKEITSPPSGLVEAIPFGIFTPKNEVFSWLLRAPVGKKIRLTLTVPQMETESDLAFEVWVGCPYDWIEVRDGAKETSPLIGRYCTPLRNPIMSSSHEVLVRLRSDSSHDSHFVIGYEFDPQEKVSECQTGNGASYRGTWSVTNSARLCQAWGSQTPHRHANTPARKPGNGLDKNYCRNPDGESSVWCYTTDPGRRWELCPVRKCEAVMLNVGPEVQDIIKDAGECYTGKGETYRGTTSLTWTGHTCQKWSSQKPYTHKFTPEAYPNSDLTNNYCRNPNPAHDHAPWCYTTSPKKRWAFCAIPKCLNSK